MLYNGDTITPIGRSLRRAKNVSNFQQDQSVKLAKRAVKNAK